MRRCGLWISPQVGYEEERIIDTGSPAGAEEFIRLRDPDTMPRDTVLVVVHPARHCALVSAVAMMDGPFFDPMPYPNGRNLAARIISERCDRDPDMRRRLRWPHGWILEVEDPPTHFRS